MNYCSVFLTWPEGYSLFLSLRPVLLSLLILPVSLSLSLSNGHTFCTLSLPQNRSEHMCACACERFAGSPRIIFSRLPHNGKGLLTYRPSESCSFCGTSRLRLQTGIAANVKNYWPIQFKRVLLFVNRSLVHILFRQCSPRAWPECWRHWRQIRKLSHKNLCRFNSPFLTSFQASIKKCHFLRMQAVGRHKAFSHKRCYFGNF